jgi:hypothetical protein
LWISDPCSPAWFSILSALHSIDLYSVDPIGFTVDHAHMSIMSTRPTLAYHDFLRLLASTLSDLSSLF